MNKKYIRRTEWFYNKSLYSFILSQKIIFKNITVPKPYVLSNLKVEIDPREP